MNNYLFGSDESEVMTEFLKIAKEQKLYDVEPSEDKTGKELIEEAHPEKETVEVTKTYHTDTGVVENENQQQKVDIEVAEKMPDNKVSRKTMAELNLQEELTLIADEMKVRGEKDLETFARKLNEKLEKEGALPLAAVVGLIAVPTLISGYLAAVHLTEPVDYGVGTNLDSLYWAVEEYKQSTVEGFAPESGSNIIVLLDDLQKDAATIREVRIRYMALIDSLSNMLQDIPRTRNELNNLDPDKVKKDMEDPRSAKIISSMKTYTDKYNRYIKRAIPKLSNTYKYLEKYFKTSVGLVTDETGQRSTWTQLWEKTKEFGEYFAKTDEQHLLDALAVTINSLKGDVQAREQEVKQIVSTLTKPIEQNVAEQFNIEEAVKDIAETKTEE